MNSLLKQLNDYIISKYDDVDMNNLWNEDENQASLKTLLKGYEIVKKPKKKKDVNAPKGHSTAYILFCNDIRDKIKAEKPEFKSSEIFRECGVRWRELKEKNPKKVEDYNKKALVDKEKCKKAKDEWNSAHPKDDTDTDKKKSPKKSLDPKLDNLKKNRSAYLIFCADERELIKNDSSFVNVKPKDILVELGIRWKSLKDEDSDKVEEYNMKATKEKEFYEQEKKRLLSDDVADEEDEEEVIIVNTPKAKKGIKKGVKKGAKNE